MYALLFDANLCVGCEACVDACKEENGLPDEPRNVLSSDTFTVLEDKGDDLYLRQLCMHCVEPACASACPVAALHKTPEGPVVYEFDKCIGCRYCMIACPFSVPRYEWASTTPRVRKCEMCKHRTLEGRQTACAEACPTEATIFGDRTELIAQAWKRIAEDPDSYAPKVYGLDEVGGTCVMMIGPPAIFDALFDPRLPHEALPEKTWAVLSRIPTPVGVAGMGLLGVHWVLRRRMALAHGEETQLPAIDDDRASDNHEGEER